jgi:DNA-binding CsgD family transcriptional regulator
MRLSHRDLSGLLAAVGILASDIDPRTLPARTNDAVKSLVSTDVLSFEAFGTDNDYQGSLWYTPTGTVSNALLQVMADLVHEQPFFDDLVAKRTLQAVRITDYVSIAQYKKSAVYNEFFRNIDTDRQIVSTLSVNPELMVSVSLCRLGKEFADRDCQVLEMLKPHLISAFRTAQFVNRSKFEIEQFQAALESTKYGVVTVNDNFLTQIESPQAAKLYRKYYNADPGSLPQELREYVQFHLTRFQGDEFYAPPESLEVLSPNAKLVVRLDYHATTRTVVLLLEEIPNAKTFCSEAFRLTQREATVLFWLSSGKTDGEIALLLEISVRTVQKHVEHIFDKLGVETRSAATASFLTPE